MTRLHVGVSVSDQGLAWAAVEMIELAPPEPRGPWGRLVYVAGPYETAGDDLALRDRLLRLAREVWSADPCFWIDTTQGGLGLLKTLKAHADWPEGLHKPHQYGMTGKARWRLLTRISQAQLENRLEFEQKIGRGKPDLVRALESRQAEVGDDGRLAGTAKENTALTALGLAVDWDTHGHLQPASYRRRDGTLAYSRATSGDPYVSPASPATGYVRYE